MKYLIPILCLFVFSCYQYQEDEEVRINKITGVVEYYRSKEYIHKIPQYKYPYSDKIYESRKETYLDNLERMLYDDGGIKLNDADMKKIVGYEEGDAKILASIEGFVNYWKEYLSLYDYDDKEIFYSIMDLYYPATNEELLDRIIRLDDLEVIYPKGWTTEKKYLN